MRCRDVQRIIDLDSGPGLGGPQCEQLQAHLRLCPKCRQALERQTRLQSLLQACEIPTVPDEFAEQVLARVASQPIVIPLSAVPRPGVPKSTWRTSGTVLGMLGAAAAGWLIGLLLGHQTWRPAEQASGLSTPVTSVTARQWEHWIDPGDDALAQTYLLLTSPWDS